jgi:hypothetical protein
VVARNKQKKGKIRKKREREELENGVKRTTVIL